MNDNIPAPATLILDLIASKEAPRGYDTVYGNRMKDMPQPLTTMTLDAVIEQGSWRTKKFGSSACGRYQFMKATLQNLKKLLNLTGKEIFTPDFQDTLGFKLLQDRGYQKFITGQMGATAFGDQIAMEWASFPVLSVERQGAHRTARRGETYYAGDKLNMVLIKPQAVEYVLTEARKMNQAILAGSIVPPVKPAPVPTAPEVVAVPPKPLPGTVAGLPPATAPTAPVASGGLLSRLWAHLTGRAA